MNGWSRALLLSLLVSAGSESAFAHDCVEAGESGTLTFDRPGLIGGGIPSGAFWGGPNKDGAPRAYEKDISNDDDLGPGTPVNGGFQATATFTNIGGSLVGPNGVVQTGFWEGDCLEVYMTWTYVYELKVTTCYTLGAKAGIQYEDGPVTVAGGVGGEREVCEEVDVYRVVEVKSSVQDICAC